MRCPFCKSDDTKVLDTRLLSDGFQVRRRRECPSCERRHSTLESFDLKLPRVIKNDKSREVFQDDKLTKGLLKSLEKRPVEYSKIESAINNIKSILVEEGEAEVKSSKIGELVMKELQNLDKIAYIRFASVYRQFQDIEMFKKEIDKLIKK